MDSLPSLEIILTLFSRSTIIRAELETFGEFQGVAELSDFRVPTFKAVDDVAEQFEFVDSLIVIVKGFGDPINIPLVSGGKRNREVRESIRPLKESALLVDDDDDLSLEFSIRKSKTTPSIPVFDIEAFADWMENLTLMELFSEWSREILSATGFALKLANGAECTFTSDPPNPINYIQKFRQVCHFANSAELELGPMCLDGMSKFPDRVARRLELLRTTLSIGWLANYATISGSEFSFRVEGVRVWDETVSQDQILAQFNGPELLSVVKWVYAGGEIADKMALFRNHLVGEQGLREVKGVLAAVRSNYAIYLKENVSNYLQLKNRISDLLVSARRDIATQVDGLGSRIYQLTFGIVTFLISVFIISTVGSRGLSDAFNVEIAIIGTGIILLSGVLVIFAWRHFQDRMETASDEFHSICKRYEGRADS